MSASKRIISRPEVSVTNISLSIGRKMATGMVKICTTKLWNVNHVALRSEI